MKARQCAGCAAPLPDSAPGQTVTCRFCGMVHDPTGAATAARIEIHDRPVKVSGAKAPLVLGIIAALVLIPTGIGLYVAFRTASGITRAVNSAVTPPAATRAAPSLSALKSLPPGYHDLDVTTPPGGFAAFDPVAQVPWALTIAQGWASDARLTRIDVLRLRPDGSVNLADDDEARARYRFASPSRIEELRRQADLSTKAEVVTEFWVEVQRGRPKVLAVRNSAATLRAADTNLPAHPRALASAALWKSLADRAGYDAPFFNGYLVHLDREGWVWYYSTLGGRSLPRVRARDGRSWPY